MSRTIRCTLLSVVVLFAVVLFAQFAFGQAATGFPTFGSFSGGFDNMNLANLNVHLGFPVVHKPGRGMPFTYDLSYDSLIWAPVGGAWAPAGNWGWRGITEAATGYISYNQQHQSCGLGNGNISIWSNFLYHDQNGTLHSFPGSFAPVDCNGNDGTLSSMASDQSGLLLSAASNKFWATTPSGITRNVPHLTTTGAATVTDPNGNQMTTADGLTYKDTLATTALTIAGSGTPASPMTYTFVNSTGGNSVITVSYLQYTVKTNFGCSGIAEYPATAANLVDKITLPDSTFYKFTYEATPGFSGDVTGRIASVTLPTGGQIQYLYTGSNNGIICADGSTAGLTRKATPNGTTFSTTTYSRSGTAPAWTTTVSDPLGNATTIQFQAATTSVQALLETERKMYQGSTSGTLLATIDTCYNGSTIPCTATAVQFPINTVTVQTSSAGKTSKTQTSYNSFGLPTEVDVYDVSSGTPPLLAKILTDYLWQHSTNHLNANLLDRVYTQTVQDGSTNILSKTQFTYDQWALQASGIGTSQNHIVPTNDPYRGNVTQVDRSVNPTGTLVTSKTTYYDTGMAYQGVDPANHATTFSYSSTFAGAYLTQVTNALSQSSTYNYDINTGALLSAKDSNNQPTSYTYDNMLRPLTLSNPDGGSTSYTYTDTAGSFNVRVQQVMSGTQTVTKFTYLDGLGRTIQTQLTSDPQGTDFVDTTYDALGRVHSVSNPHRSTSAPTDGVTTYTYDAMGRTCVVTPPDGTVQSSCPTAAPTNDVFMTYAGNVTTVTDQAGKKKQTQVDGLGRLTQVVEDPAGLNYATNYTYSVVGGFPVTSVSQNGSRARSFTSDWLGRMTNEVNPESGTVTYAYLNSSGGVCSGNPSAVCIRTAPAPNQTGSATVTTTYTYDAVNRVTAKVYSDGTTPQANFFYDAVSWLPTTNLVGRLSEEWAGPSNSLGSNPAASIFSYDAMGRVILNNQCTPANCPSGGTPISYTYDKAGNLLTVPSPVINSTISYAYNNAGRLTGVTSSFSDANHPATLYTMDATNGYTPGGALHKGLYGNGLTRTAAYNNRLEPCRSNINSSAALLTNCGDAVPSGNVLDMTYGYNYGTSNNGNVASMAAVGQETFTRSYTYDALNRLATMSDSATGATCTGLSWTYDAWGNRTAQTLTSGTCLTFSAAANANNQLAGYTYDAAGNVINDGTHSYTYDAENRMITVDGGTTATYFYDALGRRVEKVTSSGANKLDYVYDLHGNAIAEWFKSSTYNNWLNGYVYMGGLLAVYRDGITEFVHGDQLGSTRLGTRLDQSLLDKADYYDYGQQLSGSSSVSHKFTGLERDGETNLDHAMFRQYSAAQGRWMTPDPAGLGAVDPANPQSWNRYAYVLNNPTGATDPLGLKTIIGGGVGWGVDCGAGGDGGGIGGGVCWGLFVPDIEILLGGGGSGGGGGGTPAPGTPSPSGGPSAGPGNIGNFPAGESLGMPNGMPLRPGSIWSVLTPINPSCEFGPCVSYGLGLYATSSNPLHQAIFNLPWVPNLSFLLASAISALNSPNYGVGVCGSLTTFRSMGCVYACGFIYDNPFDIRIGGVEAEKDALDAACGPGRFCPRGLVVEKKHPDQAEPVRILSCTP